MHIRMIAVGDELLDGRLIESNSTRFAQRLRPFGVKLRHKESIGDDLPDIIDAFERAAQTSPDLILVCGGLGITDDDLTRLALSRWLGSPLIEDPASVAIITERVTARGHTMTAELQRHGHLPALATVLSNPLGLAIGLLAIAPNNHTRVMVLPGVVEEFEAMLDAHLPDLLRSLSPPSASAEVWRQRRFGFVGISERTLEKLLPADLWSPNIRVALNVKNGFVEVALSTSAPDAPTADALLSSAESFLRASRAAAHLMTTHGESIPEAILRVLASRSQSLSVAESCTGGLISHSLTDIPGASNVFREGFVTYANESKVARLGVNPQTLTTFGAVSRHTVCEMALGASERAPSDWSVAVSGIAGPGGAVPGKPTGLIHAAVAGPNGLLIHRAFFFPGRPRWLVKQMTSHHALGLLLCAIEARPLWPQDPNFPPDTRLD
jgi:nicotinamide-nucleotide amidase